MYECAPPGAWELHIHFKCAVPPRECQLRRCKCESGAAKTRTAMFDPHHAPCSRRSVTPTLCTQTTVASAANRARRASAATGQRPSHAPPAAHTVTTHAYGTTAFPFRPVIQSATSTPAR